MNRTAHRLLAVVVVCDGILGALDAQAFRMIQNNSAGRTSTGVRVTCNDPGGFVHWTTSSVAWSLNPANQGGGAGIPAAVQNAMSSWNAVSPATYTLSYAGTTSRGFATDGVNTILWATGNGCTGGCLAITALVLQSGQVITEADVSFNDAATWNTGGGDYDVEAIAAHELGHSLGIHHTELTRKNSRPTMYAYYFGTNGRSLETDDRDALNCSYNRYPVSGAQLIAGSGDGGSSAGDPRTMLTSRPRPRGANLRFSVRQQEHVRLDVFDIAGRRVATLIDEVRDPGEYEVAWDGSTSRGRVAAGVYFARVTTPGGRANTTIILAQ